MTTQGIPSPPKDKSGASSREIVERRLDENLSVLGEDAEDKRDALDGGESGIAALSAENGDPFPEDEADDEEPIPLPPETLARGARRI